MSFSNLDLLPQKEEGILTDRKSKIQLLTLAEKITELSIKALEKFFDKKLSEFDAQVGENLCQIRAYKILLLSNDLLNKKTSHIEYDLKILKESLDKTKVILKKLHDLNNTKASYDGLLDQKESLASFFKKNEIYFNLSSDAVFLILSNFLDIFSIRENKIPMAINYKKISITLGVSKYSSKKIIHNYQKKITQLSTDFIIKISEETPCSNDISNILPLLKQTSEEDRVVLPCYIITLVIMQHIIQQQLPLFIIIERKLKNMELIDRFTLLFLGNKSKKTFQLEPDEKCFNLPCLTIKGEVIYENIKDIEMLKNYTDKFIRIGVENILLYNTAVHPQYSGVKLFSLRENPFHYIKNINDYISSIIEKIESVFIHRKSEAFRLGFCKENPKFFHLKHVYCDFPSKEWNKKNNVLNYIHKPVSKETYANAI